MLFDVEANADLGVFKYGGETIATTDMYHCSPPWAFQFSVLVLDCLLARLPACLPSCLLVPRYVCMSLMVCWAGSHRAWGGAVVRALVAPWYLQNCREAPARHLVVLPGFSTSAIKRDPAGHVR